MYIFFEKIDMHCVTFGNRSWYFRSLFNRPVPSPKWRQCTGETLVELKLYFLKSEIVRDMTEAQNVRIALQSVAELSASIE